jgi:dipeptidyl aminopeptidase/acylaminoacyl peptidase
VRERSEWTLIDKSLQADFDSVSQIHDGDFYIVSRDLADQIWIVAYSVDDGPTPFYAYDRASRKATLLCFSPTGQHLRNTSYQRCNQSHSRRYGDLTLPVGVDPGRLPLVLEVHGGPWGRDTWGFDNQVEWLANRGYAVLQINFRGSTGYGKDYLNAGDREWAS